MNTINKNLEKMGVVLPPMPKPLFNYIPYVVVGNLVYVSGQVPLEGKDMAKGKLGDTMSIEEGAQAARICAINLLAQVKDACDGDLERLERVVKLTGFVNSTPDFGQHPAVVNGCSDFFVEALGEKGRHARSAVGMADLPFGIPVEVEGIFQINTGTSCC
ncbi:MAG: RidA family protein [Rhodobacteraceae bacterium]|nr:RidA family protein [Paracoccaceae bacterium]MCY4249769.1 RidA family protein [Paracoccaceae bacterium]MCY4307136.1 RidA family protein [Paracoccaceae bacterium]